MTQEPTGFEIRYTHFQDDKHLNHWLAKPDCEKWFLPSNKEERDLIVKNWVGFSKYKSSLTATLFDQPVGIATLFLMPYRKVSHHAMFYIIVDPKHWHKKIGFFLMKNILHLAKNYFRLESVHCEVFEGCSLIPLLKTYDFEQFAYQEKFVKEKQGHYLARLLFQHFFK